MKKLMTVIELQEYIARLKEVAIRARAAGHSATESECIRCIAIYSRRIARMKAKEPSVGL